jgi:exonuclease VII small subunit
MNLEQLIKNLHAAISRYQRAITLYEAAQTRQRQTEVTKAYSALSSAQWELEQSREWTR